VSRAQRRAARGPGKNAIDNACISATLELTSVRLMAMCKVSSSVHFVTRSAGGREGSARAQWVPNTDVYATDGGWVCKVELAGMRSDNLEITIEGNRLRISGNRPDGCRAPKCSFLVMEINYGPFE